MPQYRPKPAAWRVLELEAALIIITAGSATTVSDLYGGFTLVGPADLQQLRTDIAFLRRSMVATPLFL